MLDLTRASDGLLDPIARVVDAALGASDHLTPDGVMVVGAACRDIMHSALGHEFVTTETHDLDLGLALSSWDAFRALAREFSPVGDTGIRYLIADVKVDLMPFGDIEEPRGIVDPPPRREPMSVWAFVEVFADSLPLTLSPSVAIRIPTVAGYAAAKLGAWLDRSEWLQPKDAPDLALILHWYAESPDVHDRLYETPVGNEILLAEAIDVPLSAAHLLGVDVSTTIGPERLVELLKRWPGDIDLLVRELELRGGPTWPRDPQRRRNLVEALTRGLADETQ